MAFDVIFQTGDLCYDDVDFEMPGLIPVEFNRAYRTSRRRAGRQGYGWSWSWEIELRLSEEGFTFGIDSGIVLERFTKADEDGEFSADAGSRLTVLPDRIIVKRTDGYKYHFPRLSSSDRVSPITYIEDSAGNRLAFHYSSGLLTGLTDADARRYRFGYDDAGRITAIDLNIGAAPSTAERLVAYDYDFRGDLVLVTDRAGESREYQYDDHLMVAFRNRCGGWFYAEYDSARRCVRHWRGDGRFLTTFRFDDRRRQVVVTNAVGYSTLYRLSETGRVTCEVQPNGDQIDSIYDSGGGLIATVDALGAVTSLIVMPSGTDQRTLAGDGSGTNFAQILDLRTGSRQTIDPSGGVWTEELDERGLIIRERSPRGATTEYEYDPQGVLIGETMANGNKIQFGFSPDYLQATISDSVGEQQSLLWDQEGRLIQRQMALCQPERYSYDPLGRLIAVRQGNGADVRLGRDPEGELVEVIDALGSTTTFILNSWGDTIAEIDPGGRRTQLEYDLLGRPVEILNPAGDRMRFEYDEVGNLTAQEFFDGRRERYEYDERGHLKRIHHADGSVVDYGYDPAGRILRVAEPGTPGTTFTHDEFGRCVLADCAGVQLQYKYDEDGNCVSERQGGVAVERRYDLHGNCTELNIAGVGSRTYVYDLRDRPRQLVDFDGTPFEYHYDLRDRLTAIQTAASLLQYSYLPENRPSEIALRVAESFTHVRYRYDAAGRVTGRVGPGRLDTAYEYDSAGHLIQWRTEVNIRQFAFSPSDDLLVNSEGEEITYGAGSNLRTSGPDRFQMDGRGRIRSRAGPEGSTEYDYDVFDQLTRVSNSDGTSSEYSYDALGRRLTMRSSQEQIRVVWDGDAIVAEIPVSTPHEPISHLIDPAGVVPISTLAGSTRSYFLCGTNGYPLLRVTADGHSTTDEPHPWGHSPATMYGRFFGFSGQHADLDTGLYYNRYRYFDPRTGRYLTPDPIGIDGGMNIYSYVQDPVNLVDIEGLAATTVTKSKCKKGKKKRKKGAPKTQTSQCNPSRGSSIHNDCLNKLRDQADTAGYTTRADQTMQCGTGNNRPDLFISGLGKSVYVEFDYSPASRASGHKKDICKAHPGATVYLVKIPQSTRFTRTIKNKKPKKPGSIQRSAGPSDADCGIDKIAI